MFQPCSGQIMASEVGVVDVPHWDIASKGRLMPGNIFLVDFEAGRVIKDEEVRGPYIYIYICNLSPQYLKVWRPAASSATRWCALAMHASAQLRLRLSLQALLSWTSGSVTTCSLLAWL